MSIHNIVLRLPKDRIGALIGRDGSTKAKIEQECGVKLRIDSRTGDVEISAGEVPEESDISTARMIADAIGHGFSYERASRLLEPGNTLVIVDLREYAGHSRSDLKRIKGRIIGEEGKARRVVEELTGAYISVYDRFVAIAGTVDQVKAAEEAVRELASGGMHKVVYGKLQERRTMMRMERMKLWRKPGEPERDRGPEPIPGGGGV
ncbi:KH domain-containing protein [Conexivisphaera calida]|uniref:RNA-binding protein COG1094 n=1 Tax=Conexivisphaera calida TaxID=1874277 RepID=A0A4P2VK13_9ARCH|nr:KH domain-containing protein [Conexivisphaera calida]BBE41618.1 Putative RNA-binding protein COG1094 [Conexivisphaera calida]